MSTAPDPEHLDVDVVTAPTAGRYGFVIFDPDADDSPLRRHLAIAHRHPSQEN